MIKVCSLFSGSSGNCIFVSYNETSVLIDAGVSGKRIEEALKGIGESFDTIKGIFITHEHSDHINGAGIIARRYKIPIYANPVTWKAMRPFIGKILPEYIRQIDVGEDFLLGDIGIRSFPIPHDAACPVGYNLFIEGKKLTIATDIGRTRRASSSQLANRPRYRGQRRRTIARAAGPSGSRRSGAKRMRS
jgi:phosphoribosyl 1,2-cyclic phosphodiesterase